MTIAELLQPEFDQEMTATRRVLERVPDDKIAWKPHAKSFSMGALASHIALSTLLALFPFLIVLAALAGYLGSKEVADNLASLLLDTWPQQVAGPLTREIHNVVGTTRGGVLTIGVVLSIYFAASGVDSLRIALNRAYNAKETRQFWLLKLESIAYVLVAAFALLALGFLIVLAPLVFATWVKYAPWLAPLEQEFTWWRYGIAGTVIVIALVVAHKWLPAGRRSFADIAPGDGGVLGDLATRLASRQRLHLLLLLHRRLSLLRHDGLGDNHLGGRPEDFP